MNRIEQIYVSLLEENVDVWRPVQAEHLRENVYRILAQPYDRDAESWQFEPGEEVECEMVNSNEGRILAAVRRTESR